MTAVQQLNVGRQNNGGLTVENKNNGKHFKQQQSSESNATSVTQATCIINNNRRRIISEGTTSVDASTSKSSTNASDIAANTSVVLINSQQSAPAAVCRASSSFDSSAREEPLYIYAADNSSIMVQRHATWLAEDICSEASRTFKLTPLASYLFALRDVSGVSAGGEWLPPSFNFRKSADDEETDGDEEHVEGRQTPTGGTNASSSTPLHNDSLKVGNGHSKGLVGRSVSSTSPTTNEDDTTGASSRKRTPKRVSTTVASAVISDVEFRMRFFPSSLTELAQIDRGAIRLLFHQIRNDLLCPHSDLAQALVQKEPSVVRGLAVLDMIREMKEQQKSASEVIRDWEQYLPRNALKIQAKSIVKKLVANSILQAKTLQEVLAERAHMYDTMHASEIMEQYIRFFLQHCPQYLSEMFFIERACVGFSEALTGSGISGAPEATDVDTTNANAASPSLLAKLSHHNTKSTHTTISEQHSGSYVAADNPPHAKEQYSSSSVRTKITTAHNSSDTGSFREQQHATGRTSASPTPNKLRKTNELDSKTSESTEISGRLPQSHSVASFHGYNNAAVVDAGSVRDNTCASSVGGADTRPITSNPNDSTATHSKHHRHRHFRPFSTKNWKNLLSSDKTSTSSSTTFSDAVSNSRNPSDNSDTLHVLPTSTVDVVAEPSSDVSADVNEDEQHHEKSSKHHHRKFPFDLYHHTHLLGGGGGRKNKNATLPPLPSSARKHSGAAPATPLVTKNYVSVVFYIDWSNCNNNPSSNLDTSIGFGPVLRISVTAFRFLRSFGDDSILPPTAHAYNAAVNANAAAAVIQQQHSINTTTKSVRVSPQQSAVDSSTLNTTTPFTTAPVIISGGPSSRRSGMFARNTSAARPVFSSSVSTPHSTVTVNGSSIADVGGRSSGARNSGEHRRNTAAAISTSTVMPPFPNMFRRSTSNTSNSNNNNADAAAAAGGSHPPPIGGGCGLFTSSVNGRAARHLMRLQTSKRQWFDHFQTVATIDELCDISVLYRLNQVQVNRMNGPPVFLTFASHWQMDSFVALIDGYHRLAHRFFFNLCKELPNPSLQRLKALRCHGPVDRQFTYAKLRLRNVGAYMLCQSSEQYDAYRLDVKASDGAVKSYLIEKQQQKDGVSLTNTATTDADAENDDGCYYCFWGSREKFSSLQALLAHYCRPQSSSTAAPTTTESTAPNSKRPPALQLSMCIPPIENDPACLPLFIANDFLNMPNPATAGGADSSSSTSHMNITSSRIRRDSSGAQLNKNESGSPTNAAKPSTGDAAARLPTLHAAEINSDMYQPLCGSFTCVTRCAWRQVAPQSQQPSSTGMVGGGAFSAGYDASGSTARNYGRMPHARLMQGDAENAAGFTEREVAIKSLGKGVAVALGMQPYPKQLMQDDEIMPRKLFNKSSKLFEDDNSESSSVGGNHAKLLPEMRPNRSNMPINAVKAVAVMNDFMLAQQLCSTRTLLTGNNTQGVLADIFGVMLSPLALVMEYFPMGNIRDMVLNPPSRNAITVMHSLEAAACVAKAIWFLEERSLAHGNVRARNVFVKAFSRQRPWHLAVKLGDPGLLTQHDDSVHWRPLEAHVTTARQCLVLPQTTTSSADSAEAQQLQLPKSFQKFGESPARNSIITANGEVISDELSNSIPTSHALSRETSTSLESFAKVANGVGGGDVVDGRASALADAVLGGVNGRRHHHHHGGGAVRRIDKSNGAKKKADKIATAKIPFDALVNETAVPPSPVKRTVESSPSGSMSEERLLNDNSESQYIVESSVKSTMTTMTTIGGGTDLRPLPVIDDADDDDADDAEDEDESETDEETDEDETDARLPEPAIDHPISAEAVDILVVKETKFEGQTYYSADSGGSSTLKARSPTGDPPRTPLAKHDKSNVVVPEQGGGGYFVPVKPAAGTEAPADTKALVPLAALAAVLTPKPPVAVENKVIVEPVSKDNSPLSAAAAARGLSNADPNSSSQSSSPPTLHYLQPIINSQLTDSWAYGTFLWEVFTLGETPCPFMTVGEAENFYRNGYRLPRPTACPHGVYDEVMMACWQPDPGTRKMPQEIMRDINQFYSQNYLSDSGLTTLVELQARHSNLPYYHYDQFQHPISEEGKTINVKRRKRGDAAKLKKLPAGNVSALPQNVLLQQIAMNPVPVRKPDRQQHEYVVEKPPRTTPATVAQQSKVVFESRTMFGVANAVTSEYTVRDAVPVAGMPVSSTHDNNNFGSMMPQPARAGLGPLQYDPWIIEESDLTLLEYLGEGRYGHVQKALLRDPFGTSTNPDGRIVACKQLKPAAGARFQSVDLDDEVRQELDIMKSLRHNRIVEIIGLCLGRTPRLVMEFINGGTLLGYLQRYAKFGSSVLSDTKLLNFACDVAAGMQYLHSMSVVHRDLAARNVLVSDGGQHVKISDFGLARFVGSDQYYVATRQHDIPAAWYAPEVLERNRYACESDVWSYGVLLWELFSLGASPNSWSKPLQTLVDRLQQGARLPCPDRCPTRIYNDLMLNGCWQYKKDKRLPMDRIIDMLNECKQDAAASKHQQPAAITAASSSSAAEHTSTNKDSQL